MVEKLINDIVPLIFNGGVGSRLSVKTKRKTPKGFLLFEGKPLIFFQLDVLERLGFNSCIITLRSEDQLDIFNTFKNKNLVPSNINYNFLLPSKKRQSEYTHGFENFMFDETFKVIDNRNLLCINGDTAITTSDVSKVLNHGMKKQRTVFTFYNKKNAAKYKFVIEDNQIIETGKLGQKESNTTGLVFFFKSDLTSIQEIATIKKADMHTFIHEMLQRRIPLGAENLNFHINMNTIVEYKQMQLHIKNNPIW